MANKSSWGDSKKNDVERDKLIVYATWLETPKAEWEQHLQSTH